MFGKKFKAIRHAIGMTQAEFAKELDISSAALSKIESDHSSPRAETTANLMARFKINLNWLYSDKGDMFVDFPKELADRPLYYGAVREPQKITYENDGEMEADMRAILIRLTETQNKLVDQISMNIRLRENYNKKIHQIIKMIKDGSINVENVLSVAFLED